MYIIAVCNQKGGVGKTTLAIHLAAALSRVNPEENVLLLDLDPQGHATEGVGLKDLYNQTGVSLFEGLTQADTDAAALLHPVKNETFYVLPSHYRMLVIEPKLNEPSMRKREYRLADLLEKLAKAVDWVVIDCPPNLGLLTDNAMIASRRLVVPVQAEQTSVRALELLLDQLQSIESELKISIEILTLVPNLVQSSNLASRILTGMRENLPIITDFVFPKRVVLQEAFEAGQTVFTYEGDSSAKRWDAVSLQQSYLELATLLREKVKHHD